MISICDKELDILIFRDNIYNQRIKDEIEDLENKKQANSETEEIKERLNYLNNIISSTEVKDIKNITETIENNDLKANSEEFKKTWGRMNKVHKRIKVLEYCETHKVDDKIKEQYLKLLNERQLKTKNVIYDQEKQEIKEIKI